MALVHLKLGGGRPEGAVHDRDSEQRPQQPLIHMTERWRPGRLSGGDLLQWKKKTAIDRLID